MHNNLEGYNQDTKISPQKKQNISVEALHEAAPLRS